MLEVKRLVVLRAVAQCGSFSAAAESLSYTQSAVSQQIAALEREAGTRLVERNARGVRLTPAGEALCRHAEVIMARLNDAEAELGAIAGLRGGRVRVTSFPTAGSTIIPGAAALFRERHPGVEMVLEPAEPEDGLRRLRAGEIDIALAIDAPFDPCCDEDLVVTPLLDDPMFALLPVGHPLAHADEVRLSELAEEEWLLGSTGRCPDAKVLIRACRTAGFEPRIGFSSDDYLAIQGFVAANCGVSLIPDLALVAVRDDVVVRALADEPPYRRIFAATTAASWDAPAKGAMLDVLREVAARFAVGRRELALAS